MTCVEAEEVLLDSLDDDVAHDARCALDAHVASCGSCAEFAARMRAIDRQLVAVLPLPMPGPAMAGRVRDRQREERRNVLVASLPDLMHLGGGAVATLATAALVPVHTPWVLAIGILSTCVTYAMLAVMRMSLEAIEQPDW